VSDTRRAAFLAALPRRQAVAHKIINAMFDAEPRGYTPDQLAAMFDGRGRSVQPTMTYRHHELGLIYKTKRRRKTRAGGKAAVYRVRNKPRPAKRPECPLCDSHISNKQARKVNARLKGLGLTLSTKM